ncbi:MAG: hypothetical protein K2N54_03970, partial [Helicobacter sp.]|nr:hypothetical protein [Helicobacter sp.]
PICHCERSQRFWLSSLREALASWQSSVSGIQTRLIATLAPLARNDNIFRLSPQHGQMEVRF